ncbi:MAG: TerB family tellurite resistance protein [SAR324 cluster bacterium]|nr:TerB family tellurite resistance protein [SAR324 cluster bacterium]
MEEFLATLTPEVKNWFAKAIAGVIISDGIVEKYELEFLRQILTFLDNPADISALLDLVKAKQMPQLESLQIEKEKGFTILKYLIQFIVIDDDFHPEEEKFFRKAAKLLGFPAPVVDKFLEIADHLTKVAIRCQIEAKGQIETVRCVYIGMEGCVLSMANVLNPRTIVTLKFYPPESDSRNDSPLLYAPITGKIHRFDKKMEGIIYIKILYTHPVTINHGVPQYYDPDSYNKALQPLPTTNKSLSGFNMQCRNCGHKDFPYWSLNKGSMTTHDNIFGTTVYTSPREGFDACDYNRMQVIVCPNCYFASTLESLFHSLGTWPLPLPFDLQYFSRLWERTHNQRLNSINNLGDSSWFSSDGRTEEQAILAFDLAIETHDLLSDCDKQNSKAFHQTLIGVYLMIQAEILVSQGKTLDAERRLSRVLQHVEPIYSEMTPITQIRMARSLGIIHLYRMEGDKFNRYKKILSNTAQSKKFKEGSAAEKTLKVCLDALEDADKNREKYQKGNLTNFQRNH